MSNELVNLVVQLEKRLDVLRKRLPNKHYLWKRAFVEGQIFELERAVKLTQIALREVVK